MNLLFDSFDLRQIKVAQDMVEECERTILSKLNGMDLLDIKDEFNKINRITIEYQNDDVKKEKIQNITNKVSYFMAFQEAAYNLMIRGELMPVASKDRYNNPNIELVVNYIKKAGNVTTTGSTRHPIPFLIHDLFIRTPSKRIK